MLDRQCEELLASIQEAERRCRALRKELGTLDREWRSPYTPYLNGVLHELERSRLTLSRTVTGPLKRLLTNPEGAKDEEPKR